MDNITIIYSKRKTISLSVSKNCEIIVRAPKYTSKKYINAFIAQHIDWIEKQMALMSQAQKNRLTLSESDISKIKADAKIYLNARVAHFEQIMGVKSTGVKITSATTRWGSCSYKNSLCFSYKTMLLSKELIDYVVVHELAHILEKNHSANFYAVVAKYIPDYKVKIAQIKEMGRAM